MLEKQIVKGVWKIFETKFLSSNIYLIDLKSPMLIDLGNITASKQLLKSLKKIGYSPKDIKKIIFTHLHYDHTGKPTDFPNAEFFASKQDVQDFKKYYTGFYLFNREAYSELKKIKLKPLTKLEGFEIINTPGHTRGSICLYLKKFKTLFSGDTLFDKGIIGRTDLPLSNPKKMQLSLNKLKKLGYKTLCPGHDY
ncbi:MBL fold metallo-hydrolase [Candidatus Woesearchaeota archaeon]|nr:MBL fold metallo-hydrolase [Candidatus Woesearchaeota archaeon]